MKHAPRSRHIQGFTLLEMAFVMLVIGLLASTLVPLVSSLHHKQMAEADRKIVLNLRDEIMGRFLATGKLPTDLTGLALPTKDSRGVEIFYAPSKNSVNDLTNSSLIAVADDLTTTTVNEAKKNVCSTLNDLISTVSFATVSATNPGICAAVPDTTNFASYCDTTKVVPVAFVLVSSGLTRVENSSADAPTPASSTNPGNKNVTAIPASGHPKIGKGSADGTGIFENPQRPHDETSSYDDWVEVVTFAQLRQAVSAFCK